MKGAYETLEFSYKFYVCTTRRITKDLGQAYIDIVTTSHTRDLLPLEKALNLTLSDKKQDNP